MNISALCENNPYKKEWVDNFVEIFPSIIIIEFSWEAIEWCKCNCGNYTSFDLKNRGLLNGELVWDYGIFNSLVLFGFSGKIPDSKIVEFKLMFG